MPERFRKLLILMMGGSVLLLGACASDPYRYGTGRAELDQAGFVNMKQQVYVGRPNRFLDAADWIWPGSLLGKLLLWDKDIDSHQISGETIDYLQAYLYANELNNVQVLVNNYSPGNQWRRLFKNSTVGAGWRYTLGVLSVSLYTILPGRFFGGDSYNPYTNTIYLYSDNISVALHEGGHAKDFSRRRLKGTHAAIYTLPFAALYYEAKATSDALGYLRCIGDTDKRKEAYKLLYPAYSTYISGNINTYTPDPLWNLAVIPAHIVGRIAAAKVDPKRPAKGMVPDMTREDCLKGSGSAVVPTVQR